jgi:glycosyltransferase involved in cell wall biosynthesis
VLARAFAEIAPRIPSAQLLLVGDGRELDTTLELLESMQLGSRFTSTGTVPPAQVPAYLDACDVLVAPHVPLPGGAPFFGSPTKIFEYMAARKAIVASNLGQIGEVLEHRRTAWLVEPGDVSSLRHGLEAVAADEGLRRALGDAARKQANARHTWRHNAERIMSAYSDLARNGC